MLTILLVLAAGDGSAEQLLANARQATTVGTRCPAEPIADEVVVCGRRRADRYRLPLSDRTGGTGADRTAGERTAVVAKANNCREKSAFLVGCGMVGAGVGIGFGPHAHTRLLKPRDLTP